MSAAAHGKRYVPLSNSKLRGYVVLRKTQLHERIKAHYIALKIVFLGSYSGWHCLN